MRTDGRTNRKMDGLPDITTLTAPCPNFSKTPKKCLSALHTLTLLQIASALII